MSDKPPYKLVIKLSGTRPDALNAAVRRLDELCGNHDQVGELTTKVTIESWKEDDILAIRDGIEAFLEAKKLIIDGEVTLTSPVVRKRVVTTVAPLVPELTPMERAIQESLTGSLAGSEVSITWGRPMDEISS